MHPGVSRGASADSVPPPAFNSGAWAVVGALGSVHALRNALESTSWPGAGQAPGPGGSPDFHPALLAPSRGPSLAPVDHAPLLPPWLAEALQAPRQVKAGAKRHRPPAGSGP